MCFKNPCAVPSVTKKRINSVFMVTQLIRLPQISEIKCFV